MNEIAHEGIRKVLNLLDEEEVKQLAITTTQNLLKPETIKNKQDAVEIIIRYSTDYSSILNRKSVRKDVLFQYLHENCVKAPQPPTKLALIQKVLDYWATSSNENQELCITSEEADNRKALAEGENVAVMATKFAEWFYEMLNRDERMEEDHFWQDCSLQLNLISQETAVENNEVQHDRAEVVNVLFNIKSQHSLLFNANLTRDGIFGKMDAHGLVMVFVCGTLHTRENCVGIFEQIFSLARDPFCENNWKIKNTRLNLYSKIVQDTPKLCESSFSNELVLSVTK